ncbi:MAG: DUF1217 domain-containing protein [Rhodobacteraceae bacterium]|nr:DUF1217 domain-containing protein [Paracoccaceae bacterium]
MFTPSIIGSGLAGYRFLQSTKDAQMQAFERAPEVANDMARFKERIKDIKTVDQLMDDRALLRVALGAFGLDEDIDNTVFIRRVLESDLTDPRSTANRLSDKRYQALAKTFNFAGTDGANLPGSSDMDDIRKELLAVGSVDALFQNTSLLDRTLKAFDLEQHKDQTVFLKTVLTSDLEDTTSLPYRLGDPKFVAVARAFQGVGIELSATLLSQVSKSVAAKLQGLGSPDDLLKDPILTRSVLSVYGLEDDRNNTFFLKQVLDSDLSDPASFANGLRDPRYAQMAADLGFQKAATAETSIYAYTDLLEDRLLGLGSSDDLLNDPELLRATLDILGLADDYDARFNKDVFLKSVLDSDLNDPLSVANLESDTRYQALASAFGFGEILTAEAAFVSGGGVLDAAVSAQIKEDAQSKLINLIDTVGARKTPLADVSAFFTDLDAMLAVTDFFAVPMGKLTSYTHRVMLAFADDPDALFLPRNDPRYRQMYDAMDFRPQSTERTYPAGFAEAVTEMFLERQFEIKVGEVDPDLRIALSMERELTEAANRVSTNDGRWFTVLASQPLRAVFEGAFRLPNSFAMLDIDRQVSDLKSKTEQAFGTSDIMELLAPDRLEQIRQRYLATIVPAAANPAVSLLASSGASQGPLLNLLF